MVSELNRVKRHIHLIENKTTQTNNKSLRYKMFPCTSEIISLRSMYKVPATRYANVRGNEIFMNRNTEFNEIKKSLMVVSTWK